LHATGALDAIAATPAAMMSKTISWKIAVQMGVANKAPFIFVLAPVHVHLSKSALELVPTAATTGMNSFQVLEHNRETAAGCNGQGLTN
jgi:hypothetical protein